MDDDGSSERARAWRWLLWPALGVSFLLFALPQVFFIAMGLHRNLGFGRISESYSLVNYGRILTDPLYLSSFALTLRLSLAVTVIGLVLGFPTAYVLARAGARWASFLVSVLLISSFITVVIKVLGLIVILRLKPEVCPCRNPLRAQSQELSGRGEARSELADVVVGKALRQQILNLREERLLGDNDDLA